MNNCSNQHQFPQNNNRQAYMQMQQNCAPKRPCVPVQQACAPMRQDCAPVRQSCNPSQPNHTREQLLCYINEVSFAVTDMNLYLDTHPCDEKALEFCKKHVRMRNEALREYAKCYGPLTIDTTDDVKCNSWEWVSQPWPWEWSVC